MELAKIGSRGLDGTDLLKIRQLQKQKQEQAAREAEQNGSTVSTGSSRSSSVAVSAARLRVQKDITELDLPESIKITFPRSDDTMNFQLVISPCEGPYYGGKFPFSIAIDDNYPIEPPKIKCGVKIYHPNIDYEGNVCLNILREDWTPILNLNSIFIGLQFLFSEPNGHDPLNKDAANDLLKNKKAFETNVRRSMTGSHVNGETFDRVA
ncbi:hypothetical protein BABINDRAFT_10035 [Babjeviella inositovora NRRL Y-12698]|uniref:NEDD8-conjugating enzyme UBC12 n=1 Tax=Babjeviella inositovora NRRL Y-12698 TaxID=984486 RepID=A0A1E3QJB8_9ASCO|nr:uncharacterized protein BABINDRAFT_10035 [Babjeviella inositovora NRRL Y-12698]ODQ77708.1 hypothetical protein BABINDRAFT_10035 [Babjeviella inositovora NRRL Y-12698]